MEDDEPREAMHGETKWKEIAADNKLLMQLLKISHIDNLATESNDHEYL